MTVTFLEPLIAKTPKSWGFFVIQDIRLLLSDHAFCERKAAGFALGLLQRYGHFYQEHSSLSKLVREEMRHYELVLRLLKNRSQELARSASSGYAKHLRAQLQDDEPIRHIQMLLVAAIIEARSAERFVVLAEVLNGIDSKLATFYHKLALAEQRHHMLYIEIACNLMQSKQVLKLLNQLAEQEHSWLISNNFEYRMHSGIQLID